MADKAGFVEAVGAASQNGDALAADFIGIADRAVADQPPGQTAIMIRGRQLRSMVEDPRGKDEAARGHGSALRRGMEYAVPLFDRAYRSGIDGSAIGSCVGRHAFEKVAAGNPLGKGAQIVRFRDHAGPPIMCVNDRDAAEESRKVERGGQSGRAAADDKAVQHGPGHDPFSCRLWNRRVGLQASSCRGPASAGS